MPKLFYSPASPYARKVRVVAAEKGVALTIENVSLSPVNRNAEVAAVNPLGKVPSLVLEDGTTLFDSSVICGWLDAQKPTPRLIPDSAARWSVLTLEALGDGLLDASLLHRYEHILRPEEKRFQPWIDGQWTKVQATLDALETQCSGFGDRVDVGTIAVACALGYLDFRFADTPWRGGRPALAAWFEAFRARPSMTATAPG
jgi:glutathione S-transferase